MATMHGGREGGRPGADLRGRALFDAATRVPEGTPLGGLRRLVHLLIAIALFGFGFVAALLSGLLQLLLELL